MTHEFEPVQEDTFAVERAYLDTAELRLEELQQREPRTVFGRGVQRVLVWAARADAFEAEIALEAAVELDHHQQRGTKPIAPTT